VPIKPPEFEAIDKKTGMTLDEWGAFIESARAAGAAGSDVPEITTTGWLHPRVKTAKVRITSTK
jgi:hypothetical protein